MVISTNEMKINTCGSCKHTDNEYGVFALHCDMYIDHKKLPPNISKDESKVRSWEKACKYYEPIESNTKLTPSRKE